VLKGLALGNNDLGLGLHLEIPGLGLVLGLKMFDSTTSLPRIPVTVSGDLLGFECESAHAGSERCRRRRASVIVSALVVYVSCQLQRIHSTTAARY